VEGVNKMNEIERQFIETFDNLNELGVIETCFSLESQKSIGIYKVDFLYGTCVIEIDGHEYHKTKEQREHDYKRERYLMKKGYNVIRFMGTEIFLDPIKCVTEAIEFGEEVTERDRAFNYICKKKNIETIWGIPLLIEN